MNRGDFTGWTNTGAELTTDISEVFSRGVSVKFDDIADVILQEVTVETDTEYTFSAFMKGNGVLAVQVGSTLYERTHSSSGYAFTSVNFNSGSHT